MKTLKLNKKILNIEALESKSSIAMVIKILKRLKFSYYLVAINRIILQKELTANEYNKLDEALMKFDMWIKKDAADHQIENVCNFISNLFGDKKVKPKEGYIQYIADSMKCNARKLKKKFMAVMKISIQRYIIEFKMMKAKDLIEKDELTLSEIAILLHYSNVSYFSRQFLKETNQNPSHYVT